VRVFRFSDIVYNEQALAVSCEYLGDDRNPTLVTCKPALPASLAACLPVVQPRPCITCHEGLTAVDSTPRTTAGDDLADLRTCVPCLPAADGANSSYPGIAPQVRN
jgi:hypothetical protein